MANGTGAGWPALPLEAWRETQATLHMWTQIVGKSRLALAPPLNHWWQTTLAVTARGLGTGLVPFGRGGFDAEFDFVDHRLRIRTTTGELRSLALQARPVADFYGEYLRALRALSVDVAIDGSPDEVPDPVPFAEDTTHAAYDPEWAQRFWRVLLSVAQVLERFRAEFVGKCSPVHFFWGSFDLAVTRFSGRRAPPRPEADGITREAYSHECSSAGFWPGNGGFGEPAFYAYHAPPPAGFAQARVEPAAARFDESLGEFVLPYEAVRTSSDPEGTLLRFVRSAYAAGADAAGWDRAALERRPTRLGSLPR